MAYTNITLLALGVLGILIHCLIKIQQLKKDNTFKVATYFIAEWPTICISLIVVGIALICRNEITILSNAGAYLGLGFVTLGYMGQSVFVALMGKAQKIIEDKTGA